MSKNSVIYQAQFLKRILWTTSRSLFQHLNGQKYRNPKPFLKNQINNRRAERLPERHLSDWMLPNSRLPDWEFSRKEQLPECDI